MREIKSAHLHVIARLVLNEVKELDEAISPPSVILSEAKNLVALRAGSGEESQPSFRPFPFAFSQGQGDMEVAECLPLFCHCEELCDEAISKKDRATIRD